MKSEDLKIIESNSIINYSYNTVKITQSRLDKGLLAIPVSLTNFFPENSAKIFVMLDDSLTLEIKNYSSYKSSTRESRIGGLKEWYQKKKLKNGDEVVIQKIDGEKFVYRLISENRFIKKTMEIQNSFDNSENESEALGNLRQLTNWTDVEQQNVLINEFHRLTLQSQTGKRNYVNNKSDKKRENVPHSIRTLLGNIYTGHCQVCDFSFLKKDFNPYFEIHHLDPLQGNYLKNLLLVCANCHRQFEYANIKKEFNENNWLVKVSFNNKIYTINQILLRKTPDDFIKKLYI